MKGCKQDFTKTALLQLGPLVVEAVNEAMKGSIKEMIEAQFNAIGTSSHDADPETQMASNQTQRAGQDSA